jgi:30S ribosomal protein S31
MKSGLSFFWLPHRAHCGQSGPCFLDCAAFANQWEKFVGKGDRRTRRGKIYAGSFGKLRPKDPSSGKKKAAAPVAAAKPAAKAAAKPAAKRTKS